MANNLMNAMEIKLRKTYIAQDTQGQRQRPDDTNDDPTPTDTN